MFLNKGVLRNFAKFTGKYLCQSHVFNKVTGEARPVTLLKTWLWNKSFPMNFAKFLRTPFIIKHLRWLLLSIEKSLLVLKIDGNLSQLKKDLKVA